MHKIKIKNLEIFAFHGVFSEEKKNGQNFYVNVEINTDFSRAASNDDLSETIDYSKICETIHQFMTKNCFQLIETIAEKLTDLLLISYPQMNKIQLEIRKPEAPIPYPFEDVSVLVEKKWNRVYLGIGSNLGDREDYIYQARDKLKEEKGIRAVRISDLIETEPVGYKDQMKFLNGAIEMETIYTPKQLLNKIHQIEESLNRERTIRWGPRTIDIDILLYENEVIMEEGLIIPHVEMDRRRFVLEPLNQIAPYARHAVNGKTIKELLEKLKD